MENLLNISFIVIFSLFKLIECHDYDVDFESGLGRRYDGLGGLSGGGATSKLLVNYQEPFRSQILDYLFKPNFGASLQILKVEIGGDAESTDGTESSHMHEQWDESYERGYEWWLMIQAKKRNPAIKLYGLPWAFPGWVAEGTQNPYINPNKTAQYILNWVKGAKQFYSLDIDYIGIWNERNYNVKYVKVLRDVLNRNGYGGIQLVVADGGWGVSNDILSDPEFAQAVDFIGAHYPGTNTSSAALKTHKQLWSSEDYSTFNDDVGAGCWARILNQNYVNGYMTSTISWNLIASYYQNLPYGRDGLMTAQEPWSGHYVVESPIWITAHTTWFTSIGWYYLQHGSGVGKLEKGGSYVSLTNAKKSDVTLIIETMSHDHSICIRPALPPYTVSSQLATFQLKGDFARLKKLYVWHSRLNFTGGPDVLFRQKPSIEVISGTFSLHLDVDEVYTLTTVARETPKLYPHPPKSQTFPLPYKDNFEAYSINSEAYNFAPQVGVWEVRESGDKDHGKINKQVILNDPCYWCNTGAYPINIGGSYNWSNIFIELDVRVPKVNGTSGVFVAARVSRGGCGAQKTSGLFFSIHPGSQNYSVTHDLKFLKVIDEGLLPVSVKSDKWYHISLIIRSNRAYGYLDVDKIFDVQIPDEPSHGFVGYGATTYGIADFDNFQIQERG